MDEKEIVKRLLEKHKMVSEEYREFRAPQKKPHTLFEKLCVVAGKVLKVKPDPKVDEILEMTDLAINSSQLRAFSYLLSVFFIILGVLLLFLVPFLGIFTIVAAIFSLIYFYYYPSLLFKSRRVRASTEVVLAVLYMVIYMRTNPNLEKAVEFAADHLEGPLARDFRKLLWDLAAKKYLTIKEALDDYLSRWKGFNNAFVDAIYLIETSLAQTSEERRLALLDQALNRILNGTYETMVHYVNGLRTPVRAIFMLGITLPVMSLVLLPMIGVFLSSLINPQALAVFYDIVLPAFVGFIIYQVLSNRPYAFPLPDVSEHPRVPKKGFFYLGKRQYPALVPAALVFILFLLPFIHYARTMFDPYNPQELDVLFSLLPILGFSISAYVYTYLATKDAYPIRKEVMEVERDFGYATFQLSNRLAEGLPAENALLRTAWVMKKSKVAKFFFTIATNMIKLGMSFRRALFDEKYGAMRLYPSSMIRAVVHIFVEAIEKSQEAAAKSLHNMAQYLLKVHEIEEKIKDVLAETLSQLRFQATFVAPVIAGIIVGLTSMIMIILAVLSAKLATIGELGAGYASTAGTVPVGMGLELFNLSQAIPLLHFQLIVGVYLVSVIALSAAMASKIEHGDDWILLYRTVGKTLLFAGILYFVVALAVTYAFSGMARLAVTLGEFI